MLLWNGGLLWIAFLCLFTSFYLLVPCCMAVYSCLLLSKVKRVREKLQNLDFQLFQVVQSATITPLPRPHLLVFSFQGKASQQWVLEAPINPQTNCSKNAFVFAHRILSFRRTPFIHLLEVLMLGERGKHKSEESASLLKSFFLEASFIKNTTLDVSDQQMWAWNSTKASPRESRTEA